MDTATTSPIWNVYCDESCHLQHDHNKIMCFGAVTASKDQSRRHSLGLRAIKQAHGCAGELKWTKVSRKNIGFYLDVLNYFFTQDDLGFRALVVHNKRLLDHGTYNHGSHDEFYYKMYYQLIKNIAEQHAQNSLKVYLDIKDTRGAQRVHTLDTILKTALRDNCDQRIMGIQEIRSHESELVQLADFILGAVSYANRGLSENIAKLATIKRISESSGYALTRSTAPWETKFNLFHFFPRKDILHG